MTRRVGVLKPSSPVTFRRPAQKIDRVSIIRSIAQSQTPALMAASATSAAASSAPRGLRVLVSGASGMIGKALCNELSKPSASNNFHPEVFRLVRRAPRDKNEVFWDPYEMRIDLKKCEGMDAVIHLAGACVVFFWPLP
jgi:hypothetical protein